MAADDRTDGDEIRLELKRLALAEMFFTSLERMSGLPSPALISVMTRPRDPM